MGLDPTALRSEVRCSTDWAYRAYMLTVLFKWPLYIHVLCTLCIHWYKFENDEMERILSCKCGVLCYKLEYSYIVQIGKIHTSHVFAFNVQNTIQIIFSWSFTNPSKSFSWETDWTPHHWPTNKQYWQSVQHCQTMKLWETCFNSKSINTKKTFLIKILSNQL